MVQLMRIKSQASTRTAAVVAAAIAVFPLAGWTAGTHPSDHAAARQPHGQVRFDVLNAVAASSATDAWAVGYKSIGRNPSFTLIEHWNGTRWTRVASPSPGEGAVLSGVVAFSRHNAWAVGSGSSDKVLIEHWTGSRWLVAPTGASPGTLNSISAISPSDMWAAGCGDPACASTTLIEHWNGRNWKRVPSPNPGGTGVRHSSVLLGISAISRSNVWAVGYFNKTGLHGFAPRTLVEHWNGTSWKQVSSPNPGGPQEMNTLNGVVATSAKAAMAVGDVRNVRNSSVTDHPLAMRWNGVRWRRVFTPNQPQAIETLNSVSATSSSNAWAVGDFSNSPATEPLIQHWNGTAWKTVPVPHISGELDAFLSGVTVLNAKAAWAVGHAMFEDQTTLIMRWNGTKWKVVPSPNP